MSKLEVVQQGSDTYRLSLDGRVINTSVYEYLGHEQESDGQGWEADLLGRAVNNLAHSPPLSSVLMLRIGRALTFSQTGLVFKHWSNFSGTHYLQGLFFLRLPQVFLCPTCVATPRDELRDVTEAVESLTPYRLDPELNLEPLHPVYPGRTPQDVVCDCCFESFQTLYEAELLLRL